MDKVFAKVHESVRVYMERVYNHKWIIILTEDEFKEFEPRLKYGRFYLKMYSIFPDVSQSSIETGFWGIWDAA